MSFKLSAPGDIIRGYFRRLVRAPAEPQQTLYNCAHGLQTTYHKERKLKMTFMCEVSVILL